MGTKGMGEATTATDSSVRKAAVCDLPCKFQDDFSPDQLGSSHADVDYRGLDRSSPFDLFGD